MFGFAKKSKQQGLEKRVEVLEFQLKQEAERLKQMKWEKFHAENSDFSKCKPGSLVYWWDANTKESFARVIVKTAAGFMIVRGCVGNQVSLVRMGVVETLAEVKEYIKKNNYTTKEF